MSYSTKHVATLYNVTNETVRNWAIEFGQYLTDTTRPGKNKSRTFSIADMEVLSLVAELKAQGRTYADIHATLKSGQRGSAPELPPNELQLIASSEQERQLVLHIEFLRHRLTHMESDLVAAKREADSVHQIKEEKARIEGRLEVVKEELQETKAALEEAQLRIEELAKAQGEEYVRGVMDTLERKGDLPKKE